MIWQESRYIYEAVGFERVMIAWFLWVLWFFIFLFMSCVSVFSLLRGCWFCLGAVSVQGERVWKSPPCECESDRWTGVLEDTRRIWRSGEWVAPPPSLSCTRKNKKGLGPKIKKKRTKKRDSNSKVRDMAQ